MTLKGSLLEILPTPLYARKGTDRVHTQIMYDTQQTLALPIADTEIQHRLRQASPLVIRAVFDGKAGCRFFTICRALSGW